MQKPFRRALPLLLAAALVPAAFAQDAPPAQPVVVAHASVASFDQLNKVFADMGLPPDILASAKGNIESAAFIGPGGLATDKPLGITLWAADPQKLLPLEQNVVVSIPLVPGKASPTDLAAGGGTPIDGVPNGYALGGTYVRRTNDFLHAKVTPSAFGLAQAGDHLFDADYKDPGNLYVLAADFAALRKAAPNAYQDLAREITALPRMIGMNTPDDPKPVLTVLDKIDTLTLAWSQDPANFFIKGTLTPTPFSAQAIDIPRPAFPAGMLARLDLAYPTPETAALLEKQLAALPDETFAMGMPPVYHQRAKDIVLQIASFNSRSSAISLAVSMKDNKPTIYLVDQFSSDVDALKETTDIVSQITSLAQEGAGVGLAVAGATYTDGTHKVQRITLTPDPAAGAGPDDRVVIDEVQTGKTLYLTLSPADDKSVAALVDAGMNGKTTAILSAEVDLGAALAAAPASSTGMPKEVVQALKTSWAGQKIALTCQSSDQGLQLNIQAPKQMWRDLIKLNLQPQGPAQPQPTPGLP